MSLTKNDLQQIEKLINRSLFESFEKILIPYVDASITSLKLEMDQKFQQVNEQFRELRGEMDEKFQKANEQFRELRGDMNENFAVVYTRIDEAIALNGRYYEDCAKKDELQALELRMEKLEAVS